MNFQTHQNEYLVFSTVKSKPLTDREILHCISHVLKQLRVGGSLSVHCIGDTHMRTLNYRYRGKDKTTDVLSFRLSEGEAASSSHEELGDIFISIPQIKRQAKSLGLSVKEEFVRMLVHGILHILGYDHQKKNDAEHMFSLQEKFIFQLR